ncbi:MAG TPA: AI-2E family transporter [Candidatus Paceibacterota bacterium]|nr:AI-2E family transporter [Candidatus Paceibacterota bacterium]
MPEQTFSITTGTIVKTLVVLAGAWLVWYLRDLVLIVLTAVVIASAMDPAVRAFMRWRMPRILAVILLYVIVLSSIGGLFYVFVPSVLNELTGFISALPSYLDLLNRLGAYNEYADILGLPSPTNISPADLIAQARDSLRVSGAFGSAAGAAATLFGGVFSFILILVLSFYFTMSETGVDDFLRVVTPQRYRAYVLDLWERSKRKIGLWMQGQVLLGVIIGILVYLALSILGIKHALLLAVLAAFFELIPVFGPTLAAVPAVLIAFADGGLILGLVVIGVYIILQQFENHLIYPLVVTKVVGVPPLLVILGLIIGAQLAGFLGILLSVPVAATLQELIRDLSEQRTFASDA